MLKFCSLGLRHMETATQEDNDRLIKMEGLCNAILAEAQGHPIEVFTAFFDRRNPGETNKVGTNCSPAGYMGLITGMVAALQLDEKAAKAVGEAIHAGLLRKMGAAPQNGAPPKPTIEVVKR